MPFGAAESMGVHEILSEKICMLDHFAMYAEQCQDPALKQMIIRHMQTTMDSYNQMVAYTHDYNQAQPNLNNPINMNANPNMIQYGLRNPQPESPSMTGRRFNDKQIAGAVLSTHKNSAKNHMATATECADPNIRQMMINGAVSCCNQSYEIFLYMNQRQWYQVPTMNDHTAKTYLHHYQSVQQQQMTNPGMMPNQNQFQRNDYQGNPFLM